jgi:hypothetical protein
METGGEEMGEGGKDRGRVIKRGEAGRR